LIAIYQTTRCLTLEETTMEREDVDRETVT
jgi:hypothetical protein